MNFQAVEQANGKQVTIFGTFIEIGGAQYTHNQKAKVLCKIRDTVGTIRKIHIYQGTGQLPQPENLNQRHQFTLSTFQGSYQGKPYTGYSGFWNSSAQVNQNTPQSNPQAPQNVRQATNYQQPAPQQGKKEPNWDAIAKGKVRCAVLCGMLQGGISVDYPEVLAHTRFIMTGIDPTSVPDPHPDITEPDSDIPF